MLYAGLINEVDPTELVSQGLTPDPTMVIDAYAETLVQGVYESRDELDAYLRDASENWALERMPLVDLCILRLAVWEMLNVDEVPMAVTINEAVDLAKDFGGEDESHRFVNGVLGRVALVIDPDGGTEAEAVADQEEGGQEEGDDGSC